MKHPPQERDIIPGGKVTAVGIGMLVATAIGVLAAYGIGHCRTRELGVEWIPPPVRPQIRGEVNAMETRLFAEEAQGLEWHQRAEEVLSSYGWVDREKQIVRVPIEVAFEIWLARQREQGARQ